MQKIKRARDAVNAKTIPPSSRVYSSGNAATPQVLLKCLAADEEIKDVELLGLLLLGDIDDLFNDACCRRITHRVLFNSTPSRAAVNGNRAMYQLMHLSDIPRQLRSHLRPDIALISVAGPDNGGNYSLGVSAEAVPAAVQSVKENGGRVIAERNARLPFVLGTTIRADQIDYLIDTDYELPVSPVKKPDVRAQKIADIIARRHIFNGCTLQYGIGEVPDAVTDAVLEKGVKDLGIHTELFSAAMRKLVEAGVVTNRFSERDFSISTIFLAESDAGYRWLDINSVVQSRPCDVTNSVLNIAREPNMVAINSAIGVDLHGNIWADSLNADQIYGGIGGQSDYLRGAYLAAGGVPIIAMKSTTEKGVSKILDKSPAGVSVTGIAADPVVIVTEYGIFDPRGLSLCEHAVGIAHLAAPEVREVLLKHIYDSDSFHRPRQALSNQCPKGFLAYADI